MDVIAFDFQLEEDGQPVNELLQRVLVGIVVLEHEVPIILLLVDGAQMPGSDDLPSSLARLPEFQALTLRHDRYAADVDATASVGV